ncbi:DUF5665 domain-containing protein [Aquicoccus porphyridii]|uniref:Uncharacterized protein n=1 Tax=Aquicoccus porphyridii TaxID=1852029 RepID=A0A5A9ZJG7_9RHOB|nr:DUF5665 domain-containing protein [Aquicoccus porphyridii]KAA0917443.1 hypothetical protein FLO80_05185 [Aquicoccus porphyridii]RAI55533.1 hypothetical protein DOO74_03710 [Rhodobacteraceae bacterium AsT-22]
MTQDDTSTDAQTEAIARLTREVERLNGHRFVRIHNSFWRLVLFQFARGLAFGLGSVMGATILVSLLAWWVSQFEFLPLIGEWAAQIVDQIEEIR